MISPVNTSIDIHNQHSRGITDNQDCDNLLIRPTNLQIYLLARLCPRTQRKYITLRHSIQRLLKVRNDIVDVFDSDSDLHGV